MNKKRKQYSIVSFFPRQMTNKALFQFHGEAFKEEEKASYILYVLNYQRLFLDEWDLDISLEKCQEAKREDRNIEWITCSRTWFNMLKSNGEIEVMTPDELKMFS